ncbi:MAG: hypothetical protein GDA56_15030 [Hormoscilla sp. GM7CHS1pb]|nr:hypothetical protein [Hormoscilla sp. GM7CHS1pb]
MLHRNNWVFSQPLANPVTCIGDGHPGVWNLIDGFAPAECRREVLDWYYLVENLHKVGGSYQRLKQVEKLLWHGLIDEAKASFDGWSAPQVDNFLAYLDQHRSRLPNGAANQQLKIDIGSGSVSSTIKRALHILGMMPFFAHN